MELPPAHGSRHTLATESMEVPYQQVEQQTSFLGLRRNSNFLRCHLPFCSSHSSLPSLIALTWTTLFSPYIINTTQASEKAMPPRNPLEIPEIVDKIASHLTEKDFERCVCVSKGWRDSFLHYRWRYIRRVFEAKGKRSQRPDQAALYIHRHFVEELTIRGDFGPDKSCAYPNLRTMQLFCYDNSLKEKQNKRRIIDLDLAENYPSLNHLSLDFVHVEPQLCRALSKHPAIRNLSLDRAEIKSFAVQDFFKACKNLESLSMNNSYVNDESVPVPKDLVFERMRELNLSGDKEWFYSRVLAMTFHCPVLESFLWENGPFIIRISINHPIKKHHQPRVTDLKISRYPEDTEWASILGGIWDCLGDITHLRTRGGLLGPQASKALGHHFSALVELAMSAQSSTIRDVLCSCPKLEILTSLSITARDIAESGPWVCDNSENSD